MHFKRRALAGSMQQLRATVVRASIVPCFVCGLFSLIHMSGFFMSIAAYTLYEGSMRLIVLHTGEYIRDSGTLHFYSF